MKIHPHPMQAASCIVARKNIHCFKVSRFCGIFFVVLVVWPSGLAMLATTLKNIQIWAGRGYLSGKISILEATVPVASHSDPFSSPVLR